jgi:hypothetical protein
MGPDPALAPVAPGKKLRVGLFLCACLLFLIANRGAYKGYFQDDELDNLSFTQQIPGLDFFTPLLLPRYFENNFRPVGHLFYHWMGQAAGLNFQAYIAAIHALHLANVVLLWLLLGRLGLPTLGRVAGTLFFAFHMAAFDVYWKPMYVFDLLCCSLILLSLLTYVQGHWVVSLAAFLLAYHAKEVAIMLPVVLLGYEFLLGERRWKRLAPFFAVSLIIGVQALRFNQHKTTGDYALHFDPGSLWQCILFYSSKVFLIPYAGFAVLLALLFRERRVTFGILSFCALLLPMLVLPGRLFGAYLYVPLIGLAVAAGSLAARQMRALVAIFFLLWVPWNYVNMRRLRNAALSNAPDRRTYVQALLDISKRRPDILTFIYDSGPVNSFATRGVLAMFHRGQPVRYTTLRDSEAAGLLGGTGALAVIDWDQHQHRLIPLVRNQDTPDTSYIQIDRDTPIWQLEKGWYPREGDFRWTEPLATARLRRPPEAKQFEIVVNIGREYIAKIGRSHATVSLDGQRIGVADFTKTGWQTVRWDLAPGTPGPVEVSIQTSPGLRSPQALGSAMVAFGFLPRETK